jgi:hypothetical protein
MNNDLEIIHDSADALEVETFAVARRENGRAPVVASESGNVSIAALLHLAVERGMPAAELKELVALHERMTDREAANEFNRSLAAFRAECPKIQQNRTAEIKTQGGGGYSFTYAELDETTRIVDPILFRHGFSYSWDSDTDEKGNLTSTFILTHVNGHERKTHFKLPTQNASGMSPQQKIGAADSFAKRKAMENGLGIVTTDNAIDPASTKQAEAGPITEEQAIELLELVHKVAKGRKDEKDYLGKVLDTYGIEALDKLPAAKLEHCTRALNKVLEDRAKKAGAQ